MKNKEVMKTILFFLIIIVFFVLIIWGMIKTAQDGLLENERQTLKRIEVEAVKHGAGEYVADTNGYPVFRWTTEKKICTE